ncbi:MAG: curlin [Hyphomicrobiaceae bacterium]
MPTNQMKALTAAGALATGVLFAPYGGADGFGFAAEAASKRTVTVTINAKTPRQQARLQRALTVAGRASARIDQRGNGNAAAISQDGDGNRAAVIQRGSNHTGTITQTGSNNSHLLLQFGRNASQDVVQTGNKSGITLQWSR